LQYSRSQYLSLPTQPGVYRFLDGTKSILYVGKAKDLKSRVSSYFTNSTDLGEKTRVLVSQIETIDTTVVESELESLLLEAYFIKKYHPKYNIRMADDKSYPLIKITKKDDYPSVLFARKMDDPRSSYFGPYPNSGAVKLVLKTLRRAFPYTSTLNHAKRVCLYHHLGLCPCPPIFNSPELKKEYRKNIFNIIRVLEGKSQMVVKDLTKEMEELSENERFEEAAELKRKINALKIITEPAHRPFEYDVNPNLRSDIREKELEGLRTALKEKGLPLKKLERIECYDISNIQGTNSTGSLVVLTNGEIDKSQYRKFKIHLDGKPNDFAMMQEMLERRLKHDEWASPDLIIVDGGKGQLSSALEAMKKKDIFFPVVGLAKREETIIIPTEQVFFDNSMVAENSDGGLKPYGPNENNFLELVLPKSSPSLHLIQRIRNEAHRFAITYHRKLRSRSSLTA
jgi:excinuclease ABC subunit C